MAAPYIPHADEPEKPHPPDKIGGPLSTALSGYTFQYCYSSDLPYRVSFDSTRAHFTLPFRIHGKSILSVPYRGREVRPGIYLASWLVPGRSGHVTLVFDLENGTVDGTGLLPGGFELFDRADLGRVWTRGEAALWDEDQEAEIGAVQKKYM